jgi:acetylornithine/succinyldiaminopimelate/putrescine aminotransferase/predicted amino acid dehydrogenase
MVDDPLNPTLQQLLRLCRMDRSWVKGEGVWLWDPQGQRFLDFYSQYGAVALGHNAPAVVRAVQEGLAACVPAMVQPYRAPYATALAAELQRLAPGRLSRCVFTTSGAHAVEAALKLVRAKTGRSLVLSTHGSFHGKTLGALALTGQRQYAEGFGPLPGGVEHIPYGDAEAFERRLTAKADRIAGFFVEPIQGERGVIVPPKGYLPRIEKLCRRHGIALVVDEIQTGLGRTGRLFACEDEGIAPDVLLLAKALGGGLFPLGACLVSAEFWDERFALRHSSTFANNNIACKVGLAVLDELTRGGLCQAAAERGVHLHARLERLARFFPRTIRATRGRGLLGAVELRPIGADRSYLLAFLHEQGLYAYAVAGAVAEAASVLILPTLGQRPVLRFAPPLTISEEELDEGMDGLESAFADLEENPAAMLVRRLGMSDSKHQASQASAPVVIPARRRSRKEGRDDFAFLIHYTRPEDIPLTNPGLCDLSGKEIDGLCSFLGQIPPGVVLRTPVIRSATGASVRGSLITVPMLPRQMAERGLRQVAEEIRSAVDLAASLGAKVVGLGAYTTPYSGRGRMVVGRGPAITTGSALTAGMAVEALTRAARASGRDVGDLRVAVVGAGGSVGKLCARLLARSQPRGLLLFGNPSRGCQALAPLRDELDWGDGRVDFGSRLNELGECDLILSASGAIEPILDDAPLRSGTIVCDVARPPDTSARLRGRADVTVIEGGLVALPDPTLCFGAGNLLGLPAGIQLACFAETILLSMEGTTRDHGIGDDIPIAEVDAMMALAERHGFRLAFTPKCVPSQTNLSPLDSIEDSADIRVDAVM